MLRGYARIGVGTRVVEAGAGMELWFAPGVDHVLLDASDDLELFVAALSPDLAEHVLGRGTRPQPVAPTGLTASAAARVGAELSALGNLVDSHTHEVRIGELFHVAACRLAPPHVLSRRSITAAEGDLALSQGSIASLMNTDASSVSRRFHADVGVRFATYRARRRLMRFVAFVDGGRSFIDAALAADFGSYTQCHRVFRAALGCSPTEYFAGARHRIDASLAP